MTRATVRRLRYMHEKAARLASEGAWHPCLRCGKALVGQAEQLRDRIDCILSAWEAA